MTDLSLPPRNLVLLTGATGFVGRQVLRALVDRGCSVRLIVRAGSETRVRATSGIEDVIQTDDLFRETPQWWADCCLGVDTIIHAAWFAVPGEYLQSEKNVDCLNGTLNLAKGAAAADVRRIVGVGTCFEYDLTDGVLSTTTPLRPLSPYAEAKAAAFLALSQYCAAQNMAFAWCRLFYLYGEGEDARRLVPYIRAQLSAGQPAQLTSGTQIRDYLDVRVAGERIVATALSHREGAVNICSGIPTTVRQLAESFADEYGRRDLLAFGARPENLVDPARVVGVVQDESD